VHRGYPIHKKKNTLLLVPLILFPTVLYFLSTTLPNFFFILSLLLVSSASPLFLSTLFFFHFLEPYVTSLWKIPWGFSQVHDYDSQYFNKLKAIWGEQMTKNPMVLVLVGRIKSLLITLKLSMSCPFWCAWIILFVMLLVIQEEKRRLNMLFPRLIRKLTFAIISFNKMYERFKREYWIHLFRSCKEGSSRQPYLALPNYWTKNRSKDLNYFIDIVCYNL